MPQRFCYAYAEDAPSCSVIKKLVEYQNIHSASGTKLRLTIGFPENKHGSSNIKKMLPAVSNMVKSGLAVVILADLDAVTCAPEMIRKWLPTQRSKSQLPDGFIFRIAVREVESWLIADRHALASILKIPETNLSADPDSLNDPKAHLLNIIRAKGKRKMHREMLPGRNSRIGPEYNNVLCEFISKYWNPERAAKYSSSLCRALEALKKI